MSAMFIRCRIPYSGNQAALPASLWPVAYKKSLVDSFFPTAVVLKSSALASVAFICDRLFLLSGILPAEGIARNHLFYLR